MSVEWIRADWDAPANIVAGTTTRAGGVSVGSHESLNLGAHVGDDPAAVSENRNRLIADCELPAEPQWLHQTHSTRVVVDEPDNGEHDAFVTGLPGNVGIVMTADCLPVIFAARDGTEVAVAHAGWRGLNNGVLEKTLAAMQTSADGLLAWLGPAISQAAFEVGAEVREAFLESTPGAEAHFIPNIQGRYQADLYGLARTRLAAAGIGDVTGGEYCTYGETERFFSYRRDGQCGRMASFVFIA